MNEALSDAHDVINLMTPTEMVLSQAHLNRGMVQQLLGTLTNSFPSSHGISRRGLFTITFSFVDVINSFVSVMFSY